MKIRFKATTALLVTIRADLHRRHPFAFERVGFIGAGLAAAYDELIILAHSYRPLEDDEYLRDPSVGAMMSGEAIRRARQWAINDRLAIFHVHTHGGKDLPSFSGTDIRENAKFVPNFVSVAPRAVHGAIVLSDTAAHGQVWLGKPSPELFIQNFSIVGAPLQKWSVS